MSNVPEPPSAFGILKAPRPGLGYDGGSFALVFPIFLSSAPIKCVGKLNQAL